MEGKVSDDILRKPWGWAIGRTYKDQMVSKCVWADKEGRAGVKMYVIWWAQLGPVGPH